MQSKKLRFKNDDFFVKIRGYGTNSDWAQEIRNTADSTVNLIRENLDFDSVLRFITAGVKKANQFSLEIRKRLYTGSLRTEREGWTGEACPCMTPYGSQKSNYRSYKNRLDEVVQYPLKNPFNNFMLTRPVHSRDCGKMLVHADSNYINPSLNMVKGLYNDLHKNYIEKEAFVSDLTDINNKIAEMRWILAHTTPWRRGSDAISNVLIRSLYKSMGVKTFPLKRGVSLDLEAYCTNLDDYKKKFSSYFAHKPQIID